MAAQDLANGKDLIDALVSFGLELSLTDAYIATEWRPRALFAGQMAVNEFWKRGDWSFRFPDVTLTLLAANSDWAEAPADFHRVGSKGGLYVFGKDKIRYLRSETFLRRQRVLGAVYRDIPDFYTLRGQTTNRLPKFRFLPGINPAGANLSIDLFYERRRPTLADSNVAGSNGLDEIPVEYRDIIYHGALAYLRYEAGDARSIMEISPTFRRAVDEAWSQSLDELDGTQQVADEGIGDEGMW